MKTPTTDHELGERAHHFLKMNGNWKHDLQHKSYVLGTCCIMKVTLPGISRREGFQSIVEIDYNFIQWKEIFHHDSVIVNV